MKDLISAKTQINVVVVLTFLLFTTTPILTFFGQYRGENEALGRISGMVYALFFLLSVIGFNLALICKRLLERLEKLEGQSRPAADDSPELV